MPQDNSAPLDSLPPYMDGDADVRPWGSYQVNKAYRRGDEDIIEKTIIVRSRQMLSLQSHAGRAETWTVRRGGLVAIIDGRTHELAQGQSLDIPRGAIHALVNTADESVEITEVQRGICREDDIARYCDANGRQVQESDDPRVRESIAVYQRYRDIIRR